MYTFYVYSYVCLYVSKMNDNGTRNKLKELALFCYYKKLTPPVKWYGVT